MTGREDFMRRAVELARRGLGATAPNPLVGAALVRGGAIVAEGWHERYGGPHAEPNCLADARSRGVDPAECDLYVTLEPCNHYGRTPPCTKAILEAGVRRVFIGALDPNPTVEGGGAEHLRAEGVEVVTNVLGEVCRELIEDFVLWKTSPLPWVTLKLASTLDGRIAAASGNPEPVTGPASLDVVHRLRAGSHAVMVGGETLRADNPRLTCRLEECARQPLAVVVTSRLPAPDAPLHLLQKRSGETIFLSTEEAASGPEAQELRSLGCRVAGLPVATGDGTGRGLDLAAGLAWLRAEAGVHYVLCEGGGRLALALAGAGLVHELRLHLAPRVLGDASGRPSFAGRQGTAMAEALRFELRSAEPVGEDLHLLYKPKRGD